MHHRYNTFASAGSDGTVSIWDHKSKKRLRQYPKYHSPVPAIAFNNDGTKLAVGVSYTWEEGEEGAKTAERPAVFIKNVGEEVKVRILSWYASRVVMGADRHYFCAHSRRDGRDRVVGVVCCACSVSSDCAQSYAVLCNYLILIGGSRAMDPRRFFPS